jgi:hypothetical protein
VPQWQGRCVGKRYSLSQYQVKQYDNKDCAYGISPPRRLVAIPICEQPFEKLFHIKPPYIYIITYFKHKVNTYDYRAIGFEMQTVLVQKKIAKQKPTF